MLRHPPALLVSRLILQSNHVPAVLGVLLALAGLGYVIDNTARVLLSGYDSYADLFLLVSAVPSIVGELAFLGWPLARGSRERDTVVAA